MLDFSVKSIPSVGSMRLRISVEQKNLSFVTGIQPEEALMLARQLILGAADHLTGRCSRISPASILEEWKSKIAQEIQL